MTKSLINVKESKRYPGYFVKKYDRSVFFKNLWDTDPALTESRGHVYDATGKLVVNAPTKIFNYMENGTTIDRNEVCLVVRKINGFLACATYVPALKKVVVSTTGSLDSDFVTIAEKYLIGTASEYIEDTWDAAPVTFFFEICDPSDPHIIPEEFGAYLLGMRFVDDDSPYTSNSSRECLFDMIALRMDVKRPDWFQLRFSDAVELSKTVQHEGFVVYGLTSKTALKIKSPFYLANKLMARMKTEKMEREIENGGLRQKVDEEFYDLVDALQIDPITRGEFLALDEQGRLAWIREFYS